MTNDEGPMTKDSFMPIEIVVPRLGWSMDEGTFVEWLKNDGDYVAGGDMLFVLEGEKASQEIESFDEGILHIPADAPQSGDTVVVGQRLAWLLAEGEAPPTLPRPAAVKESSHEVPAGPSGKRVAGPAARRLARQLGIDINRVPTPDPTGRVVSEDVQLVIRRGQPRVAVPRTRVIASPRARRAAREFGVDWLTIPGSGRNGRIRERDVIAAAARKVSPAERIPVASGTRCSPSKIRRAIAQRMLAAVQQTAPVTLTTKVDASELFSARQRFKSSGTETAPSYNDMLVKLVATSLPECPDLNACWLNDAVYIYDEINIAIAMHTPHGLLAPVLRNVASLSLQEIAVESKRLAAHAVSGNFREEQLAGGTFTITNLGMFDIDSFTPIINLPQTAILGVGRIADEPVVAGERVVPGKTLTLSLTFDHRVIDGAPAARWLQRLAERIRDPQAHFECRSMSSELS